jgi:hypothetical protein
MIARPLRLCEPDQSRTQGGARPAQARVLGFVFDHSNLTGRGLPAAPGRLTEVCYA